MSSVRNELALANAQELINVRGIHTSLFDSPFLTVGHSENKRQVLREMRDQAVHVSIWLRRGAISRPFPRLTLMKIYYSSRVLPFLARSRPHRPVFRAALTVTWKPVSARPCNFILTESLADNSDTLVNIISRTYTARLAKERLEGQF